MQQTDNSSLNILITGGAGFIGSNFIPYFLEKHPNYRVINLDLLTYAGSLENLQEVKDHPRYEHIKGDICNRELVEYIFQKYDITGVIHFAAESHVDNSIEDPGVFVHTNVNGTFTLLDVAYRYWMEGPFKYRKRHRKKEETLNYQTLTKALPRFHHISTDEVYGTLSNDPNELFTEKTPYAPNSPYSASKAASDMIVRSYRHTYGMNTIITNCSNNYGPKQHDEKLIPTIIRNAIKGNPIPIYGDGKNIRDWLYVLDHCKGIDFAFHNGEAGETYNIGGRNEKDNLYIAHTICEILDELYPIEENKFIKHQSSNIKHYKDLIVFVKDRPGHDRRYAIDATKIENELGWMADENFQSGIIKTIKWYLEKYSAK